MYTSSHEGIEGEIRIRRVKRRQWYQGVGIKGTQGMKDRKGAERVGGMSSKSTQA